MRLRSWLAVTAVGCALAVPASTLAQTAGGVMRVYHRDTPPSASIHEEATTSTNMPFMSIYNNLVIFDQNEVKNTLDTIVPELATSWSWDDSKTKLTFDLREGVKWHDGKPFTSADVKCTWEMLLGTSAAKMRKNPRKSWYWNLKGVTTNGDMEATFELGQPQPSFLALLASGYSPVYPCHVAPKDMRTNPIGTGPFKFVSLKQNESIKFVKNEDYWKPGRAWFDAVELLNITDPAARQNALVTGEVDAINAVDLKTVHLLSRRKDVRIDEVTGTSHYTMPMLTDLTPFDNRDVRLAMKYAIDREQFLEKILRGHGRVGNDHPIAPANRFFAEDLEQRAYDPDKARFHLKKAGMDGMKVEVSASDTAFNGATDAAVLFKESAAAAGIDVTVKREPADGYWSNVWLKKPVCFSYWNGRPTEDWMFSLAFASGVDWNESRWSNSRFDSLLLEARSKLDDGKRREMYGEMQSLVRDDGGVIVPLFANYVDASSTRVAHGKLASNRFLDGWKVVERWWMA